MLIMSLKIEVGLYNLNKHTLLMNSTSVYIIIRNYCTPIPLRSK